LVIYGRGWVSLPVKLKSRNCDWKLGRGTRKFDAMKTAKFRAEIKTTQAGHEVKNPF